MSQGSLSFHLDSDLEFRVARGGLLSLLEGLEALGTLAY